MRLPTMIDDLNNLPEAVRNQDLYVPHEHGGYVLDVEATTVNGVTLELDDFGGLKRSIEAVRRDAEQAEASMTDDQRLLLRVAERVFGLKSLDVARGLDRDEVLARLADGLVEIDGIDEARREARAEVEAQVQEFEELKKRVEIRTTQLLRERRSLDLENAIREAGANPLLARVIGDRVSAYIGADGVARTTVIDEQGQVLPKISSAGVAPLEVGEFVESLRNDPEYAAMFSGGRR